MTRSANFIAADLGASSGRIMAGLWNGQTFSLDEIHRFSNSGVRASGTLYWNALEIWSQIQEGLTAYRSRFSDPPQGIGIDAWGVDFGLLDRQGRLLGNPVHYRDARTEGMTARVFEVLDEQRLFTETGVQTSQLNTLFQLYSMVRAGDPQLEAAASFLMISDLFLYFLSGETGSEYTQATTTQMYSLACNDWARDALRLLKIPVEILPPVVQPGTIRGPVLPEVLRECGLGMSFPAIAIASHDTASAVAAIPNMDRNSVFLSSGTWSLMGVEVEEPNTSAETRRLGFTNEGGADGSIFLLRNLTGLWILQECMRQWEREGIHHDWDDVIAASAAAPPHGSVIDPDAQDFRMPENMPAAIRNFCRTTGQPEPATVGEIARCAFESLSLKYRSVLQSLERVTGRHLQTIRIAGGGSLNTFLCQMAADCCNRQVVSGPVEASALGNVVLQAVATGHLSGTADAKAAIAASVQCRFFSPHRSDAWDEAFSHFQSITA